VWGLLLVGLLLIVPTGYRPAGLSDGGSPEVTLSLDDIEQLLNPAGPAIEARAAMLLDDASGQVLYAHQAADRLAPASITKLMTALLVVERGRYFDQVTIEAADLVGGSTMGLARGETLTVRDLLDGALVGSGNDAAYALARHAGARLPGPGQPLTRFVGAMNARASQLGLADTAFRNPAGFDAEGHYSTARDLALLARAALRQPVIAQIVATHTATVQATQRTYTLRNTNQLIGVMPGALGVKTGTTDDAGECLIALVERDGHRLLSVVLGSADRYADTTAVIDWGFAGHRWLHPPAALVETATPAGWSASLATGSPVVVPVAQVQFIRYRVDLTLVGRPGGELVTSVFDRVVARRSILLSPLGRTVRPQPGW
jgi:D-alanyl-D-alanine carboxypeptidase (penicillin-binding protein 5/6)